MQNSNQINKITKDIIKEIVSEVVGSDHRIHTLKDTKVSFDKEDEFYIIDIFVIVVFGNKIPELAWDLQNQIKKTLEEYIKINTKAVNFHIQGVKSEKEGK